MVGRRSRKSSTLKKLAIGSALAAGAGYVAGVLTAPKSGRDTRTDIKNSVDKSRVEAEKELKKLHTELDRVIKESKVSGGKLSERAQTELKELVTRAKDTKEKAREVISAIHEGDAEDKDLKRAVKDASAALKHLRDYLKK
jgi:gas vesicle protein